MVVTTESRRAPQSSTGATAVASRKRRLPWLLAWLAFVPLAIVRAGTLAETDTFWQVRAGLLTLAQHAVPRVDPFSWTARGEPWMLNSWGYNVFVALGYRLAGLPGVAVACALVAVAAAGLALLLAKRLQSSPLAAAAVLLLASPMLIPWLSARPQLVDYVAVLLLVLLLSRLVDGSSPRLSIVSVGLLSAVWVNLHSAALLGVAIAGVLTAMLLTRPATRRSAYRCLAATCAAMAGALVNPYGFGLFSQTAGVKSASSDIVVEWQHLDATNPSQAAMFLLGLLALATVVRRGNVVLTAAISVLTVGSVLAIRILPLLLLVSIPVIASMASHQAVVRYARRMRLVLLPGAAISLAGLAALAVLSASHIGRPDPALYPITAVRQIPQGCRLFNSYLLGGFVILERPDVLVSIDSRNDFYGAARVIRAARELDGDGDTTAALAGAGCVLVPPSSGLARKLDADTRWRRQTSEPAGALYLRM